MRKHVLMILTASVVLAISSYLIVMSHEAPQSQFQAFIYTVEDGLRMNAGASRANSTNEKICFEFVQKYMQDDFGGVFTNYLETSTQLDHATGHEVLSESLGLMMLYAVKIDDKTLFDQQNALVKQAMLKPEGLIRWRFRENDYSISHSSASIDDLRIIKALLLAEVHWKASEYGELAMVISDGLLENGQNDGQLVNHYNTEYIEPGNVIDLSYIDLKTMAILTRRDSSWGKLIINGLRQIKGGKISETFPLYYKEFNVKSQSYERQTTVNVIDSLTTMLHLSEVGELDSDSVDWLYAQFNQYGRIFIAYNMDGTPATEIESTAAYALIARLAKASGDSILYEKAISRMELYQILDETSPLYGAFGFIETLEVYSYDNLQALLAY